nr:MAG TPA: hypothetical protein [Caudoviricetes sp.]
MYVFGRKLTSKFFSFIILFKCRRLAFDVELYPNFLKASE